MPARTERSAPCCAPNRSTIRCISIANSTARRAWSTRGTLSPRARQVSLPGGAHALDAERLGRLVERAEDVVQDVEALLARHAAPVLLEADDVGEEHRDLLVVLDDRAGALLVALRERLGHEGAQQPVVLGALLVDEGRLQLEAAAHVVERGGDVGELVALAGLHLHALLSRCDAARRIPEPAQRTDREPGDDHRDDRDDADDDRRRQREALGELVDGCERLGTRRSRRRSPTAVRATGTARRRRWSGCRGSCRR